jgi:hypothetical protein
MKYCCLIFIFTAFSLTGLLGQNFGTSNIGRLPVVSPPQMPNPNPSQYHLNQRSNPHHNPNELTEIQKRNQAIIDESIASYMNAEIRRQSTIKMLLEGGFPSQSYQDPKGTNAFYQAFEEINQMLTGEIPMNLGRAVFLVENAYYNDSLDYAEYQKAIKAKVELCNAKIKEEKLNGQDNIIKNMMLFSILTDTMKVKTGGNTQTSYPLKYDLEDYESKINYDSHFITKLMRTGVGQCHSMPLYFLILAEEMGAVAYLSFAPRHSFVKIKDKNGAWYNLEVTCAAILTDAHYMNHNYIKAEALQNRLYLEPLDKTSAIAQMLVNLASGYYEKYGMDDFFFFFSDTAMEYFPNNIDALMFKSVYETGLIRTLGYLYGAENTDILLERCPESAIHFEKRQMLYQQIDDLGYEELPPSIYARWLEHVDKLKEQQSKEEKPMFLRPLKRD